MNCKVSVIIPVYNMKKNVKICLENVLSQSLNDIEIICINDGSTDGTDKVLAGFAAADERVKVINQKNSGSGAARNAGIKFSCGEYLAFMDADDYFFDKFALEKLYDCAKNNSAVVCGGKLIDGRDKSVLYFSGTDKDFIYKNKFVEFFDYQEIYGYQAYIYKADFIKTNGILFKDYRRYQDPPWFLEVMLKCGGFYSSDIDFYVYFPGCINPKWNKKQFNDLFSGILDAAKVSGRYKLWKLQALLYERLSETIKNIPHFVVDEEFKKLIDSILRQFNFEQINKINTHLKIYDNAEIMYKRLKPKKKNFFQNIRRFLFFGEWSIVK